MKVTIYYTTTHKTTAEVDDKFQALRDFGLTQAERMKLKQELVKEATESIPPFAMLADVWSDDEYCELLARTAMFAGPSAP